LSSSCSLGGNPNRFCIFEIDQGRPLGQGERPELFYSTLLQSFLLL
jgi:hypothetical protein